MSPLWSPSAENACDSLITVSRIWAPWPRRLSAAVLTKAPSVLTPPGSVGCSVSVSLCSCSRTSSHSTGTAVRSCGMAALSRHRRAAGIGRGQLDGPRGHQRRRQDRGLGVGGHLVFGVDQKVILTRRGWGSILSILPTGTPRMRTSSPAKIPLLFGEIPDDVDSADCAVFAQDDGEPGDQTDPQQRQRQRFGEFSSPALLARRVGEPSVRRRHIVSAVRRGGRRRHTRRRRRGRAGRRPAGWRGRRRLAIWIAGVTGIAGDRVGQTSASVRRPGRFADTAWAAAGSRAGRSAGRCAATAAACCGSRPRSENAASTNG